MRFVTLASTALTLILGGAQATAQDAAMPHDMSQHHAMDHNVTTLPSDCAQIAAEHTFTIHAGARYSSGYPGTIFGYDVHELRVEPCSRITVTFVNEDQVRHQWMVHGLPRYLYPAGMFHLEANGGESQTGSFIVPSDDRTYLVHCDLTQHMEKGMKAQLVVGRGSGDLWAIPRVSAAFNRDPYWPPGTAVWLILTAAAVGAGAGLLLRVRRR
jgi:plastocyanin